MSVYFGEDSYLAILLVDSNGRQIPTPVGANCAGCGMAVAPGDQGFLKVFTVKLPYGPPCPSRLPIHLECDYLAASRRRAHEEGRCPCVTGRHESVEETPEARRTEALKAWRRRHENQNGLGL